MHRDQVSGFSLVKFLMFFLVIFVVIAGGLTATYFIVRQQQTTAAELFIQNFIIGVEKNDPQTTYAKFAPSLKSENEGTSYYTWLFWLSGLTDNKTILSKPTKDITYKNSSPIDILSSKEIITFTYTTNSDLKVLFETTKTTDGWELSNYATGR